MMRVPVLVLFLLVLATPTQAQEPTACPPGTNCGTLKITCAIQYAAIADIVACHIVIDGTPQLPDLLPGQSSSHSLPVGAHVGHIDLIGDQAIYFDPPSAEKSVNIFVGQTTYWYVSFMKRAHLTLALSQSNVMADFYVNGEQKALQLVSTDLWVPAYKSYKIEARNITDPAAGGIYQWRDAITYSYPAPGSQSTVKLYLYKKFLKGFLNLKCNIINLLPTDNAYCQPEIDVIPVDPVLPGATGQFALTPGTHSVLVRAGPDGAWYATPAKATTYISAGYTSYYTANLSLTHGVPADAQAGLVTHIVDGDTIDVLLNGVTSRIRYIGLNTPETNQVCGSTATYANTTLVSGKTVALVKDISETDQFGRLLRYVYAGDLFVNAELVKQGYAQAKDYPPDTKFSDLFHTLEDQARAANIGCWPTGVFNPPVTPQPTAGPPAGGDAACDCSGNLYNCSDFQTHAQAQACFNYCLQVTGRDVHQLDGDNDGFACETLP